MADPRPTLSIVSADARPRTTGPLYAGFDLGTSNSAAAVFDGEQVTVVRNAQGGSITPSVVRFDRQGRATVGARARRALDQDPANTASEFKRLMGTDKSIVFPAAQISRKPEELSAEILRALRTDVADQCGADVTRAVISVPALFELPQSAATSEAARLAGFSRVELLPEPIASALAAGWRASSDGGGSWLVYDFGGGTFDVSLLETRDGLLRVVGHDGDNFLGGRDFDWAITEFLAAQLPSKTKLSRRDPSHADALRLLRAAAEDAKVELSRQDRTQVILGQPLAVGDERIDVELELDRETVERLCRPLIDRSLDVCLRLMTSHGLTPGRIGHVVLVGGPTVMPFVRHAVAERLQATLAEGLDPMTLVAQGAALYAATAGLEACEAKTTVPVATSLALTPVRAETTQVWLQYPSVSADLTPHVVGRFVGAAPTTVRFVRHDGAWTSLDADVGSDGSFVGMLSLLPRKISTFTIEATRADGTRIAVEPASFAIVQGLTVGDPPLSRSVGVALANDHVQVYLERGAPLPARRTFSHTTVETVARGAAGSVVRIPIVQGEFGRAHLCRLVGTLEISGLAITSTVPAGSAVEVTIELDRGGRMTARALVPAIDQVFEHVEHLLVPEASPESLDRSLVTIRDHLMTLRQHAFRHNVGAMLEKLDRVDTSLLDVDTDIEAAHGGDTDAAQKARRALIDIDALLVECDLLAQWPELDGHAQRIAIGASSAVAMNGSDAERRLLDDVLAAMERARKQRDATELERQINLATRLALAASQRSPDTWVNYFDDAASEVASASDLPRANKLVVEGRAAMAKGDHEALRRVVKALWMLLPADAAARRHSFDSGVR